MGKEKNRKHKRNRREDRDHSPIASLLAPPAPPMPVLKPIAAKSSQPVQDRREWQPVRAKPPKARSGKTAPVSYRAVRTKFSRPHGPTYLPKEVPTFSRSIDHCRRRKVRREVMFATGRFRRASRVKRRNQWSDVHCR